MDRSGIEPEASTILVELLRSQLDCQGSDLPLIYRPAFDW